MAYDHDELFESPQAATSWFYSANLTKTAILHIPGGGFLCSDDPVTLLDIAEKVHGLKPGQWDGALPSYWWEAILEQSDGVLGDNPRRHFVWTFECEEPEGKPYPLTLEAAELLCSLQ